jgi:Flp pilus assembly pilin Flp
VFETLTRKMNGMLRDEAGQALAEFSLVLLFVALACIISLTLLGGAITGPFLDFIEQAGFGGS